MLPPVHFLLAALVAILYPLGFEPLVFLSPPWDAWRIGGMEIPAPLLGTLALCALYAGALAALGPLIRRGRRGPAMRWIVRLTMPAGLATFAAAVFVFHYPLYLRETFGAGLWPGVDILLLVAPYLVVAGLRAMWAVHIGLAPPGSGATRLRFFLAFGLGPLLAIAAVTNALDRIPGVARALALYPALVALLLLALTLGALALAPFLLRACLGARPVADPALRERLRTLAARAGFRCRAFLRLPTGSLQVANAFVTGLIGPLRYVFFTDALLEDLSPEEIEGVLGHEMAHALSRHFPTFLAFFAAGLFLTIAGTSAWDAAGLDPSYLPLAYAYVLAVGFVTFGFLSRRFESEADLVGARWAGSGVAYVQALERVAALNGVSPSDRSWRHHSISRRAHILFQAEQDPEFRERFLRRCRRLRVAVLVGALAAAGALAVDLGRQVTDPGAARRRWDLAEQAAWWIEQARSTDAARRKEAIRGLESAADRLPEAGSLHLALAQACEAEGRVEEALLWAARARRAGIVDPRERLRLEALERRLEGAR